LKVIDLILLFILISVQKKYEGIMNGPKKTVLTRIIYKIGTATEDRVFERFFLPIVN